MERLIIIIIQKFLLTGLMLSTGFAAFAQNEIEACSVMKPDKDGNFSDTTSPLTWQRCPYGQSYSAGICTGEPERFSWRGAHEAAARVATATRVDWILPTKDQLDEFMRKCMEAPIKGAWTSTSDRSGSSYAWKVSSNGQSTTLSHTDQLGAVWLVRRSGLADVRTFKDSLAKLGLSTAVSGVAYPVEADETARAQRADAQSKREEEIQRKKDAAIAAEAARQRSALFSKKADPKMLYLRAGKYERDGESDKAKELYGFIADNFSTSDWAVKASDRLLSFGQGLAGSSAGRASGGNAQPFSRLACVTWQVEWSTNPFFKSADIVNYEIRGNFIEASSGQCEVKVKSQRKTTFISDSPPYKNNETVVLECVKLAPC